MNSLGCRMYCQRTWAVLNQAHTFLSVRNIPAAWPELALQTQNQCTNRISVICCFKWHSQHPKSGSFWGFISAARNNSKPVPLKADLLLELPNTTRPLHSRPSSRPTSFTNLETQWIFCFVKPKTAWAPCLIILIIYPLQPVPIDHLSFTTLTAPSLVALRKSALKARQHIWQDLIVIHAHQPLLLQNQPLWRYHSPRTPAHLGTPC